MRIARIRDRFLKDFAANVTIQNTSFYFLVLLTIAVWSNASYASKMWMKYLSFPEEANSMRTLSLSTSGVFVSDGKILVLANKENIVAETPYVSTGKTREEKFGKITDSKRHKTSRNHDRLRGAFLLPGKYIFLDGVDLVMSIYDEKTFQEVSLRSIVWDLIKPAADRGGEPTKIETEKLRSKFKNAYRKTSELKITGMTSIFSKIPEKSDFRFLVSSRIKQFPLLMLRCSHDDPNQCLVERKCNISGKHLPAAESISGIALDKQSKMLLIGDSLANKIHVFRYASCFHAPKIGEIKLHPKLKQITNIFVDQAQSLWLTTTMPDDYMNASLFEWKKGDW